MGKSNVYRALGLMRKMAEGRFAEAVAEEGGLPSLLWAGELKKNEKRRMRWEIEHDDFSIEMECGMIPTVPGDPTMFKTDPDVKLEVLKAFQSCDGEAEGAGGGSQRKRWENGCAAAACACDGIDDQ